MSRKNPGTLTAGRMGRAMVLALACLGAGSMASFGADPAPGGGGAVATEAGQGEAAARRILTDRLLNDARAAARSGLPQGLATRQALALLQAARGLSPDSLEVLRALAEAAGEARNFTLQKDAYVKILELDHDDLVAQAGLITALAEAKQSAEDQARVYEAMIAKNDLDVQVRSETALRLARLLLRRGATGEARKALDTAVKLNDANAGAWEEIVRLQATGPSHANDRMASIASCLSANPYLPHVWLAGGRVLAAANQHDLAADFLGMALDAAVQFGGGGGDLLLEWGLELAITGDPRAEPVLTQLAKLDDAPLSAMVAALSVRGPSLTAGAADPLVKAVRERVAASVKAAGDGPAAAGVLADAAWIEIFYMPDISPAAGEYLEKFGKLVGAGEANSDKDDAYRARKGWLLLRQGKLTEASAILAPVAAKEPFAQLGVARIAAAKGDAAAVRANLQDLFNAHPGGMLAMLIQQEARRNKVGFTETPVGVAVRKAAKTLPPASFKAFKSPRDVAVITPLLTRKRVTFGEPVVLSVKVFNASERALAVGGPGGGGIKTSIGLAGQVKEPVQQALGVYAVDNAPRIFRLPPRGSYTTTVRVDQDQVYEVMTNAWRTYSMSVGVVTYPQPTATGITVGLGGQVVSAGEFVREGVVLKSLAEAAQAAEALPTLSPDRQMLTGLALAQLLTELADGKAGAADALGGGGADAVRAAREKIAGGLARTISGDAATPASPLVQAWFLRQLPDGMPKPVADALAAAAGSRETAVRMAGAWRAFALARPADEAGRRALIKESKGRAEAETDPVVKAYAETLTEVAVLMDQAAAQAAAAATGPATAPATAPATVPATVPATGPTSLPKTAPAAAVPEATQGAGPFGVPATSTAPAGPAK